MITFRGSYPILEHSNSFVTSKVSIESPSTTSISNNNSSSNSSIDIDQSLPVCFSHDPRLLLPSYTYYNPDQVSYKHMYIICMFVYIR